jgi:mono/diheme cytochrome c family protein
MKRTSKIMSLVITAALSAIMSLPVIAQQKKGEPWIIPDEYKQLSNPVTPDEVSVKAGQLAFEKKCALCHGKTGLGDGFKGKMCRTFPGDFSSEEFQSYTDGEIFFQTRFGRGEMPAYGKTIPDNEIWNMVNYIRTLKK